MKKKTTKARKAAPKRKTLNELSDQELMHAVAALCSGLRQADIGLDTEGGVVLLSFNEQSQARAMASLLLIFAQIGAIHQKETGK